MKLFNESRKEDKKEDLGGEKKIIENVNDLWAKFGSLKADYDGLNIKVGDLEKKLDDLEKKLDDLGSCVRYLAILSKACYGKIKDISEDIKILKEKK